MRAFLCVAVLYFSWTASVQAGNLTTLRFGEQDTCKITGVTTVTGDKSGSQIKFDLAKLPKDSKITDARLRLWVVPAGPFGFDRWNEKDFDGFKCWQIGKEDKPLDACFPFEQAHYALQEWNVTTAVKEWAANPGANQGFRLNVPLPGNSAEPAWRRPYLQVTYDGAGDVPPPPTEVNAFYRSGQVFLTWKMSPYDGAFFEQTFRVYMHSEPITPENLDKATLLGEANRNSNLNYRRTVYYWDGCGPYGRFVGGDYLLDRLPKDEKGNIINGKDPAINRQIDKHIKERYNFVIDDKWTEKTEDGGKWMTDAKSVEGRKFVEGPELSDDTGLYVHTVKKPGSVYFAVTSVIEGQENRKAVAAFPKAVEVKVEPSMPVLQCAGTSYGKGVYPKHYRIYAYWGGGDDGLHTHPSTPFMIQMFVPMDYLSATPKTKVVQWGGSTATMAGDLFFPPPTPRTPFPSLRISLNADWGHWIPGWKFYYGSRKKPDAADPEAVKFLDKELVLSKGILTFSNFYGYHDRLNTGLDPHAATVRPFIENRILAEMDMYAALFPTVDKNCYRVMGGSRSLMNFAMHRPDRIACASSAMDTPWTGTRAGGMWPFLGKKEWALKVPEGFNVWDWNDPIWFSRKFPARDWPFITTCVSPNYDRGDDLYNWQDLGYPQFYKELEKDKRAGWWWWADTGDAPDGGGWFAPLNEAIPALGNVTCSQQPLMHWPDERKGTTTGYIEWHHEDMPFVTGKKVQQTPVSLDIVDEEPRFEMAFRIRNYGLFLNGPGAIPKCGVDFGMADITPRRLQKFKVEKAKKYAWKNVQVATGRVLQSGMVTPDENGLLTVPQVFVDRNLYGNKLIIVPGDKAEAADTASKVVVALNRGDRDPLDTRELEYAEYAAKCREPEMVKMVKAGRVFTIQELTGGSKTGDFYTEWGSYFSDAFSFPAAGRYRLDVKFRTAFCLVGAWPDIHCSAALPDRQDVMIDSDQPKVYSWWIDMDAPGRRNVIFNMVNRCFNSPAPHWIMVNGKNTTRGYSVDNLTFTPLGKRPDSVSEVFRTYIVTRSIETGVNVPVQVRAEAQDAWGEALDKKPAWTVSAGATISADGVFSSSTPGTYQVTATVDGKSETVPVVVAGDAWVENFDDLYEDGWSTAYLGSTSKEKVGWDAKSIHQYGLVCRDRATVPSILVWDGGYIWRDYTAQADRLSPIQDRQPSPHSGLAFRYVDKDNFYRFEQDAARKNYRLVKVVKGQETELAKAAKDVPPITVTGEAVKDYPSFKIYPKDSKYFDYLMKGWTYDRFKVEVKGDKITGFLNDIEVVTATDGDLKGGTIGLFCDGSVRFDNVSVKPVAR